MDETPHLVASRVCGDCIVCCKVPSIDDPLLTKPAGELCRNCSGAGCTIYTARPQTCRDFHCQWRYLDLLDENWRPDRSGVLISTKTLDDGQHGENGVHGKAAMVMVVFGDHAVVFDDGFARLVAISIDRGVEVVLSLPYGAGLRAHETALRPFVAEAVASGSLAEVKAGIRAAYDSIWTGGAT